MNLDPDKAVVDGVDDVEIWTHWPLPVWSIVHEYVFLLKLLPLGLY